MSRPKPYHDCPVCPSCGTSAGVPCRYADVVAVVQCAACGHTWHSEADAAKAIAADAAWERKQCRDEAAAKRKAKAEETQRLFEEHQRLWAMRKP